MLRSCSKYHKAPARTTFWACRRPLIAPASKGAASGCPLLLRHKATAAKASAGYPLPSFTLSRVLLLAWAVGLAAPHASVIARHEAICSINRLLDLRLQASSKAMLFSCLPRSDACGVITIFTGASMQQSQCVQRTCAFAYRHKYATLQNQRCILAPEAAIFLLRCFFIKNN